MSAAGRCQTSVGECVVNVDDLSEEAFVQPLLQEALKARGLLNASYTFQADTPLPEALLSAARLHAMDETELWVLEPPAENAGTLSIVQSSSASGEWRALMKLNKIFQRLCIALAAKTQIDSMLLALCHVPPEREPLRIHHSDETAQTLLRSCGGRGSVRVVECAAGGRGLVASRSVGTGGTSVAVPASALITAATARAELPEGVIKILSQEGLWAEHLQVMVLLMYVRAHGAPSKLASVLSLLPPLDGVGVPPSAWSDDELESLRGTDVYWSAHAARGELLEIRESLMPRISPLLRDARLPQGSGTASDDEAGEHGCEGLSKMDWLWAKAVLDTRAMSLPASLGEELPAGTLVLAPILDLCNHDDAPKLVLDSDLANGELGLRAVAPIAQGEQLYISYGKFNAIDLLLHYGIAPQEPKAIEKSIWEGSMQNRASTPCASCHAQDDGLETSTETMAEISSEHDSTECRPQSCEALMSVSIPSFEETSPSHPFLASPRTLQRTPPLMLRLSLTPSKVLMENHKLLSQVHLLIAHLGLELDVLLPTTLPVVRSPAKTISTKDVEGKRTPGQEPYPSALPSRLLGAARLCAIRGEDEMSTLSVALAAGEAPLSSSNEAAALRLIGTCCQESIETLMQDARIAEVLAEDGESSVAADESRHAAGDAPFSDDSELGRERKRASTWLAQAGAEYARASSDGCDASPRKFLRKATSATIPHGSETSSLPIMGAGINCNVPAPRSLTSADVCASTNTTDHFKPNGRQMIGEGLRTRMLMAYRNLLSNVHAREVALMHGSQQSPMHYQAVAVSGH